MKLNSQSTALNLFLINQFEKEETYRRHDQQKVIKGSGPVYTSSWIYGMLQEKVTLTDDLPVVEEPTKWANTSINRNLKEFLKHNDLPDSLNPLNDHSLFADAPVLAEGWITPSKKFYQSINPRRQMPRENLSHFGKFECILDAVGYDENNPVCLDKHGRILDGAYRMKVMSDLYEKGSCKKIYVRQYDFE